jgi:hypothetical protein
VIGLGGMGGQPVFYNIFLVEISLAGMAWGVWVWRVFGVWKWIVVMVMGIGIFDVGIWKAGV